MSHSTLYLEAFSSKRPNKPFIGSGFLVNKNGRRFIVTNYHVISDKGFYNNKVAKPKGPYDKLNIVNLCEPTNASKNTITIRTDQQQLFYRNYYKEKLTDLVAIEILSDIDVCVSPIDISRYNKYRSTILSLNSPIYLHKFERDGNSISHLAIQTSITSKPQIDIELEEVGVLPLISTKESGEGGMSGGPVFKVVDGEYVFVGVYSASNPDGIGYFWRPDVVEDLVSNIK